MSKKTIIVGNTSFSEKGYEKFVTLSRAEQEETIGKGYNPKAPKLIENALKNVPNGDNGSGNAKANKANNASGATAGNSKNNSEKPATT